MQRGGKRKSPFTGQKADGGNPLLYTRYTDLSQILLEPAEQKPSEPSAPVEKKSKKEKAPKHVSGAAPPAAAAAAAGDTPETAPKGKGTRKGKAAAAAGAETGPSTSAHAAAAGAAVEDQQPKKARTKPRWTDDRKAEAKAEREAQRAARRASLKAAQLPAEGEPSAGGEAAAEGEAAAAKQPAAEQPGAGGAPTAAAADEAPAADKKSKKGKKAAKAKLRPLPPEERVSGPGNAEEAQKIRDALGFVGPEATSPEFAFGFAGDAAAAGNGNGRAAGGGSSEESGGDGSSSDETSSSSSSESDDEQPAPVQPAAGSAAAGTAPPAALAGADSEYVPRRVYVGGMPYSYTEDQVREYWSYCGEIEGLDIMTFPDTGRFRGIAFITFTTDEAFESALACDGEDCDGQTLKVQRCKWSAKERAAQQRAQHQAQHVPRFQPSVGNAAERRPPHPDHPARQPERGPGREEAGGRQPPPKAPAPKTAGYNVAYVGNLAYEAGEGELRALFEACAPTVVRIHTDKDTGRPKGFAHVHFGDEESLDKAVALDGTSLLGRSIRVGYAQPKKGQPAQ